MDVVPYIIADHSDIMTIAFYLGEELLEIVSGKAGYMLQFLEEMYEWICEMSRKSSPFVE